MGLATGAFFVDVFFFIVDNFTNIGSENKAITVESIEEYREVWLRFDPKGTFAVPSHSLLVILQQLRAPLGIADKQPPPSRAEMLHLLGQLDIPDHGGQIHFMETLTALAHQACGVPVPVCVIGVVFRVAAVSAPMVV